MKRILFAGLAFFLLYAFGAGRMIKGLREDRARLFANQTALQESVERYRTADSLSAAGVAALRLERDELAGQRARLAEQVEALGIKLRRVEAAAATATVTEIEVETVVRDTVIIVDSAPVPARAFRWSDPWTNVGGVLTADSVRLQLAAVDTIIQVVHRVPRRFLGIRFGTKGIRQEVTSRNPHTTVVFTEYIEFAR